MANGSLNVPGLLMDSQRYNNQSPLSAYNPLQPMASGDPGTLLSMQYQYQLAQMAMQQEMQRNQFQQQQPMMALPSNFGNALGQVAGAALFGQSPQASQQNQQAWQQNPMVPPGGTNPMAPQNQIGAQPPGPPQGQDPSQMDPNLAMYYSAQSDYRDYLADEIKKNRGSNVWEARYKAAARVVEDEHYQDNPIVNNWFDKLAANAKAGGYEPLNEKDRSESYNVYDTVDQRYKQVYKGSELEKQVQADDTGRYTKGSDQAVIPIGEEKTTPDKGLNRTDITGPSGSIAGTRTSTSPATFGVNANGTVGDVGDAQTRAPKVWSTGSADAITKDLTNRDASTKIAIDGIDNIIGLIDKNPASIGQSGDILRKLNDWRSTASGLTGTLFGSKNNYDISPNVAGKMAPIVDRFRGTGIDATVFNGAITDLAYSIEAAQGNTNTDPQSRKNRIDQIKEDILGDNSSDPLAQKATLQYIRSSLVSKINTTHDSVPQGVVGKPIWLQKEVTKSNLMDPKKAMNFSDLK
jgi:hypothetical protein